MSYDVNSFDNDSTRVLLLTAAMPDWHNCPTCSSMGLLVVAHTIALWMLCASLEYRHLTFYVLVRKVG